VTSTAKRDFLLEIGTEEIPARLAPTLLEDLESKARDAFEAARLAYEDVRTVGTPRRLALLASGVSERQRDEVVEVKGPSEKVAFGETGKAGGGEPTRAAQGFARGQGVAPEDLIVKDTPAGPYVFARRTEVGRPASEVLAEISVSLIRSLDVPRPMRWGDTDFRFIRPIRWIVALYGDEVLPVKVAGVTAGRATRGHRFLAAGETPTVFKVSAYTEVMERVGVMVDPEERSRVISEGAAREAARHGGWPMLDDDLLEEIAFLVEYPTPLAGSFPREFLELPAPVLVTTMRHHQRYIPVAEAQDGTLLPVFIIIRNGGEEGLDLVRAGNEKVLQARLSDARFFFEEDRKRPLADRVDDLDGILFLQDFGTMRDKTDRLVGLAGAIWEGLGLPAGGAPKVGRAARLAKADLATKMVYELTELQGVMGREYALLSGEDPEVAEAIAEHYLPTQAGGRLPESHYGRVVSIADKLDTIVGCFAAGIEPTGSHDPYGLRRQAAGVLATAVDAGYLLPLATLLPRVADPFRDLAARAGADRDADVLKAAVLSFFLPRLRLLLEDDGIAYDVSDAATAGWSAEGDPVRVLARARALRAFKSAGRFEDLSASYIRVTGLADKASGAQRAPSPSLLSEDAELGLYQACLATRERVDSTLEAAVERARKMAAAGHGSDAVEVLVDGYSIALDELSNLRQAVDRLFDEVLVMTEDETTRENRLALIKAVADLMGVAGDLSKLVVPGD